MKQESNQQGQAVPCEELARRAALFAEGARRLYGRGANEGDMWFFELYHFLKDAQVALSITSGKRGDVA